MTPSPQTHPTVAASPGRRLGALAPLAPRTILLVEDSRFAAEGVRMLSRSLGFRLRRAASLAEACAHLRVYRPDVAMIDIGLPDGSGLALVERLTREPRGPVRIVALSGDPGVEGAALAAGAQAFLAKPFSLTDCRRAMIGSADLPDAGTDTRPDDTGTSRNAGADPLALADDLRLVTDLLNGPPDAPRLHYAGQFLASLATVAGAPDTAHQVRLAAEALDPRTLIALASDLSPGQSPV